MTAPTSASTSKLLWLGNWFGENDAQDDLLFSVQEDGIQAYWTVAETLARIDDFSELARTRILECCNYRAPLYDVINDQGAMLLCGVTHVQACAAIDQGDQGAEWQGDMRIRRQR